MAGEIQTPLRTTLRKTGIYNMLQRQGQSRERNGSGRRHLQAETGAQYQPSARADRAGQWLNRMSLRSPPLAASVHVLATIRNGVLGSVSDCHPSDHRRREADELRKPCPARALTAVVLSSPLHYFRNRHTLCRRFCARKIGWLFLQRKPRGGI